MEGELIILMRNLALNFQSKVKKKIEHFINF